MNTEPDVPLTRLLELRPDGAGLSAQITPDWAQGRAAFGGLVAALLARALETQIPAERPARSLLIDFVAPVAAGAVHIDVQVLRSGRALSHAEARLSQGGAPCALMIGTFGVSTGSSLRIDALPPPSVPSAASLPRAPYVPGLFPRFVTHFDQRWASVDELPFSGKGRGEIRGYVAHAEPGPADLAGVLAMLDAWPPATLCALRKPAMASTATWMVDLCAPLARDAAPTAEHYLYAASTVAAHEGYGSIESRLWSPSGALVAASRQLTLEFS
jgi:acyl-CoA thioesterase